RAAEGQSNPMQALIEAHALVSRFREAAGFRMILLGSPGLLAPEQFGPSDPVDGEGLWTLGMHVEQAALTEALATIGLEAMAPWLKPGGDPIADLSDRTHYGRRHEVLALLRERGWLVPSLSETRATR